MANDGLHQMQPWGPSSQGRGGSSVGKVQIRSGGTWGAVAEGFKLGWGAMDDTIKAIRDRKKQQEAKAFGTKLSQAMKQRTEQDNTVQDLSKKTWGNYTTQSRYEKQQREQGAWESSVGARAGEAAQSMPHNIPQSTYDTARAEQAPTQGQASDMSTVNQGGGEIQ